MVRSPKGGAKVTAVDEDEADEAGAPEGESADA
jgi:hypothetical protein